MNLVKVSVVIPFFNRINFLEETIRSVLNQTYSSLEIILVDDASTERLSMEQYRNFNVQYIRNDKNRGPASCRFQGLHRARGTYVTFLDSDDLLAASYFDRMIPVIEADKGISFVYCFTKVFDDSGVIGDRNVNQKSVNTILPEILTSGRIWCTSSILWRRSILSQIQPFTGYVWEDYRLDIEAAIVNNHIGCLPEYLCFYRNHAQARASQNPKHSLFKLESLKAIHRVLQCNFKMASSRIVLNRLERLWLVELINLPDFENKKQTTDFLKYKGIPSLGIRILNSLPIGFRKWLFYQRIKYLKISGKA